MTYVYPEERAGLIAQGDDVTSASNICGDMVSQTLALRREKFQDAS